jgi:hypothetical protein
VRVGVRVGPVGVIVGVWVGMKVRVAVGVLAMPGVKVGEGVEVFGTRVAC